MRQANFRRFWTTTTIDNFAEQVSNMAIPLTAAVELHAPVWQVATLYSLETLPFALFSLPLGVWLDRNRKFPALIGSQILAGAALASIPIAAVLGILSIYWMYAVAFLMGCANLLGGSSAQTFLTNIVSREQLVDAHSKFAITDSAARLMGPGLAGQLVGWLGAPRTLLFNAFCFFFSVLNLSRIKVEEPVPTPSKQSPLQDVIDGIKFVYSHPILRALAWGTALWQILFSGYVALQVLYATRELGMSPALLGAAQMAGGFGVLASSLLLKPMTNRFGTGKTILFGLASTSVSWLLMSHLPAQTWGSQALSAVLYGGIVFLFDCGMMLYFMPYLALRVKVTPDAFLGRMISTMRFMTVAVSPLGALSAGWLGEHFGLRPALTWIGLAAMLLAVLMVAFSPLRNVREEG
ncbi:MAG: MFS transporter [Burkholderiales bacterium]|nr:MFS transporter [Burkholderiales bacterium]